MTAPHLPTTLHMSYVTTLFHQPTQCLGATHRDDTRRDVTVLPAVQHGERHASPVGVPRGTCVWTASCAMLPACCGVWPVPTRGVFRNLTFDKATGVPCLWTRAPVLKVLTSRHAYRYGAIY